MAASDRKALEAFFAQAVHDWRQPLQAALGHLDLVLGRQEAMPSAARASLQEATDALQRLGDGFAQALQYLRSGQAIEPEAVDLEDVLHEVCHDLEPLLHDTAAIVGSDGLPKVQGDRLLLGRLLQNLVSNAAKYHGQAPPRIHLWAESLPRAWRLNVQDNGVGMDPDQLKSLGRPFRRFRPDLATGTGLGLASCQRIAQAHGGRLWAESGPSGSTFHVQLPKAPATRAAAA